MAQALALPRLNRRLVAVAAADLRWQPPDFCCLRRSDTLRYNLNLLAQIKVRLSLPHLTLVGGVSQTDNGIAPLPFIGGQPLTPASDLSHRKWMLGFHGAGDQ